MSVILQSGILSQPGPAGGGDFDMLALSPSVWWDISDAATIFADEAFTVPAVVDSKILKILDKSGNGVHGQGLYPSSGHGPYLRSVDGRHWADTSGAQHENAITTNPGGLFQNKPNAVVIIVWFPWNTPPNDRYSNVFMVRNNVYEPRIWYSATKPSAGPFFRATRVARGVDYALGYPASPQITVLRGDYAEGTLTYKYHSSIGDYLPGYTASLVDGAGLSDPAPNDGFGLIIGGDSSGGQGFGMFGEVVCFEYNLSYDDEAAVVAYLKAKWGISSPPTGT